MSNIFKEAKDVNEHPKRNNFDLSKKINASFKFGKLYPVYCQPVVPGDSFSIDAAYNIKAMPIVFPVQSKIRAHMHFFFVRNKNLWTNWENWISNLVTNEEHPHPYLSLPDSEFTSGSIHDFMNVPTTLVSEVTTATFLDQSPSKSWKMYKCPTLSQINVGASFEDSIVNNQALYDDSLGIIPLGHASLIKQDASYHYDESYFQNYIYFAYPNNTPVRYYVALFSRSNGYQGFFLIDGSGVYSFASGARAIASYTALKNLHETYSDIDYYLVGEPQNTIPDSGVFLTWEDAARISYDVDLTQGFQQYSDMHIPLYSSQLHINALAYRAYESIFYAFYNNNVLNPLKINGQVQYNRYNTNLGDGADSTPYHLFSRNYELDFLTSALPSPQQGVAPLVGMTALGDITIEDENGITTAHADIDNDGTISKVVLTSPAASIDHARTAMNIAASGMSINDFRQTNALQRLLETNIRKGYRYLDFIAGHFGKEPEYRELDMPEFIGGFSRDVNVSTILSQSDTLDLSSPNDPQGKALGQFGGYASVTGGTNHSIRHYCDDYGYIIGIMSIVPTPCYSQLLPKHMVAPNNFLDYYFPEFASSGLQSIPYKEVAPIQCYLDMLNDNNLSLEDSFGYQRPNYDLVSAVDEVHGDFRGSLRNFVINRIFDGRPELGQDFIEIKNDEINDIFVDTDSDSDNFIGEIAFKVNAKRPIPRVVIPNLGK